jgi:hypothetical protein
MAIAFKKYSAGHLRNFARKHYIGGPSLDQQRLFISVPVFGSAA